MEECIAGQSCSISLDHFLRLVSEPLNCVWINTAPPVDSFAVVGHRVKGPEVEQFFTPSLVINGLDIIARAMDSAGTLLRHADVERHVEAGDSISSDVSLRVVVALDLHIGQLLFDEGLGPLIPLSFVPSRALVPSISTNHVAS